MHKIAFVGDVSIFNLELLAITRMKKVPLRIAIVQKMNPSVLAGRTGISDPSTIAENKIAIIPYIYSTENETSFLDMMLEALNSDAKYQEIATSLQRQELEIVLHGYSFLTTDALSTELPSVLTARMSSPDGFLYVALRPYAQSST